MSNSSLVDVKVMAHSSNYTQGRKGKKIKKITIHHMAGKLTAKQCGNVFQKKGRNASSNYGIGSDAKIGLYVDEANRAWTSSNAENDYEAVTIEVANSQIGGQWKVSSKSLKLLIKSTVLLKTSSFTQRFIRSCSAPNISGTSVSTQLPPMAMN